MMDTLTFRIAAILLKHFPASDAGDGETPRTDAAEYDTAYAPRKAIVDVRPSPVNWSARIAGSRREWKRQGGC